MTGCGTWPFGSQIGSILTDSVANVLLFSNSMWLNRDESDCAERLFVWRMWQKIWCSQLTAEYVRRNATPTIVFKLNFDRIIFSSSDWNGLNLLSKMGDDVVAGTDADGLFFCVDDSTCYLCCGQIFPSTKTALSQWLSDALLFLSHSLFSHFG